VYRTKTVEIVFADRKCKRSPTAPSLTILGITNEIKSKYVYFRQQGPYHSYCSSSSSSSSSSSGGCGGGGSGGGTYSSSQGLPFEVIDRSLSLIDRLNTRQAIEFSIAY